MPEIQDILETRIDESGVRLYKISWKTSWISEGCLQHYKEQLEEFWNKKEQSLIMDRSSKQHDCNQDVLMKEKTLAEKHEVDENESSDEALTPTTSSIHQSKRKCSWNLEDIVLKLKRSKNTNSGKPPCTENSVGDFEDDEYALSPVFPRDMSDDQKFLNQKSSLLTQLEQKDNMILMESYEKEWPTELSTNDEEYNSNEDSNGGEDEEEPQQRVNSSDKHAATNDLQLAKLLDEEKNLGCEGSDKIEETKCNKCSKRFYRRSQLIRHLSNHVVHECLQCNAVFYCVKKYKKHMSAHETYPCDFCNEEFYDASAWYKHRAKHTMMECSCCDMIFYNKAALAKHKFEHSEYICPLCRYACENLHYWISHRNYHGRCSLLQPIIACRECKSTFGSQETFLKHKCDHTRTTSSLPAAPSLKPESKQTFKPNPFLPVSKSHFKRDHITQKRSDIHKRLITRPEPVYLAERKSKLYVHPFRHQQKSFKRQMDKKEIKDLIGIDQTLTCSS